MFYLHKASIQAPYLQQQRLGCGLRCPEDGELCGVPGPSGTGLSQDCLALERAHPN